MMSNVWPLTLQSAHRWAIVSPVDIHLPGGRSILAYLGVLLCELETLSSQHHPYQSFYSLRHRVMHFAFKAENLPQVNME